MVLPALQIILPNKIWHQAESFFFKNRNENLAPSNLNHCFGLKCHSNYLTKPNLSQNRNVAGTKPFLFKNRIENLAPSNLKNCLGLTCLSKYLTKPNLSQNRNVAGTNKNLAPSNLKNCFGLKCLSKYLTKTNLDQNRNVVGTETFLSKNRIEIQEPSNLQNCFGKCEITCIVLMSFITFCGPWPSNNLPVWLVV